MKKRLRTLEADTGARQGPGDPGDYEGVSGSFVSSRERRSQGRKSGLIEIDRIEEILLEIKKVSEDKGYVLNEEIEELVGAGFDPDEIIELYDRLSDENIEFFDSREKAILKLEARKKRAQKEAKKSEEMLTTTVRYDDPVRMYLREMGKVPLLNREGEIEIAKRIEDGAPQDFPGGVQTQRDDEGAQTLRRQAREGNAPARGSRPGRNGRPSSASVGSQRGQEVRRHLEAHHQAPRGGCRSRGKAQEKAPRRGGGADSAAARNAKPKAPGGVPGK